MDKRYIIIAGVNGAGKSTLYSGILSSELQDTKRVNADEILKEQKGNWQNKRDQFVAMKETLDRIQYNIKNGISFNHETTLAGKAIMSLIEQAKASGFKVNMYYVGLDSADLAVKRVQGRVEKGGHGIPEEVIRARYEASLKTLGEVIPLCDNVKIFDNTKEFNLVASFENDKEIYRQKCGWLDKSLGGADKEQESAKSNAKEMNAMSMSSWRNAVNSPSRNAGYIGGENSKMQTNEYAGEKE